MSVADGVLSGSGLESASVLLGLMGDDIGVVCLKGLDCVGGPCDAVESRRRKGELRGEVPKPRGDGLYPEDMAWRFLGG